MGSGYEPLSLTRRRVAGCAATIRADVLSDFGAERYATHVTVEIGVATRCRGYKAERA